MNEKIKRSLTWTAIIALVAVGGYFGWNALQPKGPGPGFVSGNGRIEATEVDVATKLAGRIINIMVDEGDFVRVGQPLAQMQVDQLQADRDTNRARYQEAIQNVSNAVAQVAARESDMASAQAVVSQRESDLATARAVVAEREAELDAAQRRFARSSTLSKEGASSVQELDDDRARVATAEAALAAAKAQVDTARAAISAATAQVATAQATINAANAQVGGTRLAVEADKATIQRVDVDIKDSTLTSPRDGRVQFRVSQPGEVLSAGGKVLNLVDLGDVYMTFFVPEAGAGKIAMGSESRIVLDARPDLVIPATVSFVSSVAQFTPKTVETAEERQKLMFRVKAQIDRELLRQHLTMVKTGLPGVAWVKLDPQAKWPKNLTANVPGTNLPNPTTSRNQ